MQSNKFSDILNEREKVKLISQIVFQRILCKLEKLEKHKGFHYPLLRLSRRGWMLKKDRDIFGI